MDIYPCAGRSIAQITLIRRGSSCELVTSYPKEHEPLGTSIEIVVVRRKSPAAVRGRKTVNKR